MHLLDCLASYAEEEGCFFTPYLRVEEPVDSQQLPFWHDLPNLPKHDSMIYISQFLDLLGQEETVMPKTHQMEGSAEDNAPSEKTSSKKQKERGKKIRKTDISPFHNYQKHLNNALKKIVIVPCFEDSEETYKKAARDIWERYLSTEIKTKKILHAVFNERNEHCVNESELRLYNLWDIYTQYGENTFNRAKIYLSKLAIDQIDHQNIEGYLKTRKLKKIEGFREYVLQFRQELCNGYLKRRINAEQLSN